MHVTVSCKLHEIKSKLLYEISNVEMFVVVEMIEQKLDMSTMR